ncbi:hypothetical protein BsWGS_01695 [Bradybaena similaris]
MSKEIPESMKNNIRALLLSRSGGIALSEFVSDYCNRHREPLRFRDFGFSSLQEFMKSLPDVVRVVGTKDSQVKVFGVELNSPVPSTSRFKEAQGCLAKDVTKFSLAENVSYVNGIQNIGTNGANDDGDLIPDQFGLWSVYLPLSAWKNKDPEELVALFRQAGDVKKTQFTERNAFIRYASKEEALLAVESFSDLKVTLAKNHFKSRDAEERMIKSMSNKRGNITGTEVKQSVKDEMKRWHSEMNNTFDDRNAGGNKDTAALEKLFGKFYKDGQFNGSQSEWDTQSRSSSGGSQSHKDERRYERPHTDTDCSGPRDLFFGNIDSVDDFRVLIKPYDPVSVNVKMKDDKIFAFVTMKNVDCARQAIRDLHNKQQRTRSLIVNFTRQRGKGDSGSVSGESSFESQPEVPRMKDQYKILTEMPPLIHVSELGPEADKYELECCIYVAYFPCNTPESLLRKAFDKYHVLDVYILNNSIGPSCTKAILYLATLYDVINAVREMNNSCFFDVPLKVEVPHPPYASPILRAVVDKEVSSKFRALSHH